MSSSTSLMMSIKIIILQMCRTNREETSSADLQECFISRLSNICRDELDVLDKLDEPENVENNFITTDEVPLMDSRRSCSRDANSLIKLCQILFSTFKTIFRDCVSSKLYSQRYGFSRSKTIFPVIAILP